MVQGSSWPGMWQNNTADVRTQGRWVVSCKSCRIGCSVSSLPHKSSELTGLVQLESTPETLPPGRNRPIRFLVEEEVE